MNSISEARELKKRIGDAIHCIRGDGGNYSFEKIDDAEILETLNALHKILILAWRDLDSMIEEWEDAKGIDRPL